MSLLLQIVVLMGGLALDSLGVNGRAIDIGTDWAAVELREPLTAKTGNPRLLLYARQSNQLGCRALDEVPPDSYHRLRHSIAAEARLG